MNGVTFICGCQTKDIVARENVATMSMVTFDEEGFLICVVHKERRYGWHSIPVHQDDSVRNAGSRKHSYFTHSPLEREAHIVFGEDWPQSKYSYMATVDVVDMRNAVDPEVVGNLIKSRVRTDIKASEYYDRFIRTRQLT